MNPPKLTTPRASDSSEPISVSVVPSPQNLGQEVWNALWERSEVPSAFARYEWVAAWWKVFGRGRTAKIYTARTQGDLVGILPTAWPEKKDAPIVLMGDWHADYAAVLTDPKAPAAFPALLEAACADVPARGRLVLAEIRDDSSYHPELERRSGRVGSRWVQTETTACPRTEINPDRLEALINKDSLKRHSRKLRKLGHVTVHHATDSASILPRLDDFFAQHVARWAGTPSPSLFLDEHNQTFYRELVRELAASGLLLFTEVSLDNRPVAFHFGFLSEGDFVWYKPSFEPALAKISPGETLLRELFIWAGENPVSGFDFTRGGESFKARFATRQRSTATFVYHGSCGSALGARTLLSMKKLARERLPESFVRLTRHWYHQFRN